MIGAPGRSTTAWEPFSLRGRSFVRTTVRERGAPDFTFAIAQPLAGRYRVEDLFVAGETTVLLWAVDLRTHRPVAIKALRSDGLAAARDDPDPTARLTGEVRRARHLLQAERRLLVRLHNAGCNGIPHPNDYVHDVNPSIAGLPVDGFLVENEPYLVLQRLTGVSLERVLEVEFAGGMDERLALEWIRPLVRTLEALHQPWRMKNGRTWHCVYQDLKPSNVVIDPLGRPSLLDFGGCQVVVDGVPVLEGACTPGYCPPECEGPSTRVLLPCADVYTIGSTLHHMLTGIDPRDRLERQRGEPGGHLRLGDLPARCSPGVRRLLERCLAPRPSQRLADAHQVGEVISSLIGP
jgi:serine/threonine protein kinase